MNSTLSLLLVFLSQFFMPRHNAQLRLLKAQIAILRARIHTDRIILSPAEKAELIRIGAEFGHEIDGLMEVAKPATYKRWLAVIRVGRPFKAVGRPRLTQELRDVVIRIGSENLLWGYKRIAGELKKLGLYAGANSVKRILNDAGIHPSPEKRKKKPALPWTTFIRAHMETMVACDFFSKTVPRVEERSYRVYDVPDYLAETHQWPHLGAFVHVVSKRKAGQTASSSERLYLLPKCVTAQVAATLIRGHWEIENSLHWSLDVVMNDDQHRARKDNAPANFAALRRIALGIIKANTAKGSNRVKFKKAGWSNDFLRTLIKGF